MERSAKRARLPESGAATGHGPDQSLVVMVLDVEQGPSGTFHIWGRTSEGATTLVQVHDYCPYVYVAAPTRVASKGGDSAGTRGSDGGGGVAPPELSMSELDALQAHLNGRLPSELRISSISSLATRPIMYYRPAAPAGAPYLRLTLRPGASAKRAAAALSTLLTGRQGALLEEQLGLGFSDRAVYEGEVKLLTRFLCDSGLSGGAWFFLAAPPPPPPLTAGPPLPGSPPAPPPPAAAGAAITSGTVRELHYTPVHTPARISSCEIEVAAPWRALQSLTPDATQLADPEWCPPIVRRALGSNDGGGGAADTGIIEGQAGQAGRHMGVDGGASGSAAPALEPQLAAAVLAARDGAIAPLTVLTVDVLAVPRDGANRTPVTANDDPVICIGCDVRMYGTMSKPSGAAASHGGVAVRSRPGSGAAAGERPTRVVFLMAAEDLTHGSPLSSTASQGAELRCFDSEREMLLAWKEWVLLLDPDIVATYQVRDTLGALRDRFERLRLEGGGLLVSRLAPVHGSSGGSAASPMTVKSVVMYSVAWVKRQGRMSSTSNQETFQAEIRGRVVVDVLRQVLTSQSLATFSLVDCCQSVLKETLEVLGPLQLARLWSQAKGCPPPPPYQMSPAAEAETPPPCPSDSASWQHAAAAAARITAYIVRRVDVIVRLMSRLATLPEALEMARVTGLTLPQVMYNAQMIRTWSLLHRNAHRQNYIIGGRQDAGNLIESPFLLHPIENRTAGLYRTPVATLDFASLYPSLYRAYNLCYTTLVHPDDVDTVGRHRLFFTPTGHAFVKSEVRQGILPAILAALMVARTATRTKLKAVQSDAAAAAVLDSRQKALKVTANALYGFTGAAASPLQCLPLADSCLALGAGACRAAIAAISDALARTTPATEAVAVPSAPPAAAAAAAASAVTFGPAAAGGKVIYAQTDSVFVHFPRATPEEAVRLGKQAAALVTVSLPPPMELKYERVMAPFLLLHVNRYAGRAVETEEDAVNLPTRGSLLVKGVRSMWRQSAPFVSQVLQGSLERILMRDDVAAAVSYAEGQIRRLLSGRVNLRELAMTGGLWRVTGQQVAAAAAAAVGADVEAPGSGGGGSKGGGAGAGPPAEDVRGPHAALAVRLSHRDPGRRFLLGERLSYVLLAGARTQDEAAEDPLAAAQRGAAPALELYWKNKLQPPLKELFSACVSPATLQALLTGPLTLVRVDAGSVDPSSWTEGRGGAAAGASSSSGGLVAGPGSPRPNRTPVTPGGGGGGGGGGGFGLAMTPRSPPLSGRKARGGAGGGGGGNSIGSVRGGGRVQSGLSAFFRQTARCLACRQPMPSPGAGADSGAPPGLCSACEGDTDILSSTYLGLLYDDNMAVVHLNSALSTCLTCHSGGHLGPVLCENGECGVLFERLGAARRLAASDERLGRLPDC